MSSESTSALARLRAWLQAEGLQALYSPRTDEYLNENLAAPSERIAWFTGFSGSAGTLVVTAEAAVLFVDGRYELQADQQLHPGFQAQAARLQSPQDWLISDLAAGSVVGYPEALLSIEQRDLLAASLAGHSLELRACSQHPLDQFWHTRPAPAPVRWQSLATRYAGESVASKLKDLRTWLASERLEGAYITAADSVSWLLNLRSDAVPYSGVALARLLVREDKAHLFSACELPSEIEAALASLGVEPLPESELAPHLFALDDLKLSYDPSTCPSSVQPGANWVANPDYCRARKACKSTVELEGMRRAQQQEGAVWRQLQDWLQGQSQLHEADLEAKLVELRQQQPEYLGESFAAIVGSGANAAVVHYRHQGRGSLISAPQLILLDSGAHYASGSTDTTRTLLFGDPARHEWRLAYTRVLRAHIALASLSFPARATCAQLDAVARAQLWRHGWDYQHGTGHGVGLRLNIHESPPVLSARSHTALQVGMVLSIEPGFYAAGDYGVRLENLYSVAEHREHEGYLCFEPLTTIAFAPELIAFELLSADERQWLETYQALCG